MLAYQQFGGAVGWNAPTEPPSAIETPSSIFYLSRSGANLQKANPREAEPLLATITAASVQGRSPRASAPGSGCADASSIRRGDSLRSAVLLLARFFPARGHPRRGDGSGPAGKAMQYVIRPPLAAGRLQILDTEHVAFR